MDSITFFVPGDAIPQGSMAAKQGPHQRYAQVRPANEKALYTWRARVAEFASRHWDQKVLSKTPVEVRLTFIRTYPQSLCGTGRNAGIPKLSTPIAPVTRPDIDKLERAILDALTGIVFDDDACVTHVEKDKAWGKPAGVIIDVRVQTKAYHYKRPY